MQMLVITAMPQLHLWQVRYNHMHAEIQSQVALVFQHTAGKYEPLVSTIPTPTGSIPQ
jgi:hypothetical protein